MTGDPKVLGPLQQAFLATDKSRIMDFIGYAWERETGDVNTIYPSIDHRIRAWTPPDAEPSLEQRVEALSVRLTGYIAEVDFALSERIAALELFKADALEDLASLNIRMSIVNERHPEPTAPDDPVCADCEPCGNCGHRRGIHGTTGLLCREPDYANSTTCECPGFVPAPQPAPDDPVCAREGCGHKRSDHEQGIGLPRFPTNCKRCSCSSFLPAPQAAPDLDPVRVEAATKALFHTYNPSYGWDDHREWHFKWRQQAEATIRAYLNGETR